MFTRGRETTNKIQNGNMELTQKLDTEKELLYYSDTFCVKALSFYSLLIIIPFVHDGFLFLL